MKEDKLPQKKLKGVQKTGSPRSGSKKKEEEKRKAEELQKLQKKNEKLGEYMKNWLRNRSDNTRIDPTVPDNYEMGDELHREVPHHVGVGRAEVERDDQGAGAVDN